MGAFQIWMLIHAIREKEWIWALFILAVPVFGPLFYYLQVIASHAYARARVQLAELLMAAKESERARGLLEEVLNDAPHAPAFDRKRERVWVRRARKLLRHLRQPRASEPRKHNG